ncbi:MAG: polysaccharide biosynthesis C-terminal domain-containing protein [Planctomycetota bacterium]|jgi:UDP-2-acetamido-2,6-beta-L-arabino-hexul-4-ose reductase
MTSIRLGITGATGMMGWHLRCACVGREDIEVVAGDRSIYTSAQALRDFVGGLDAVVHFAGMNRGDEQEVHDTNIALAGALLEACESVGSRPHLVFANSTHNTRDSLYGASKRTVSGRFLAWAEAMGVGCHDLVLPHVFGEGGKPFYNSVVHTFCHQLARDEEPNIDHDGDLELLHAGDVADLILDRITGNPAERDSVLVEGRAMKVSELLGLLQDMHASYRDRLVLPDLRDPLHLRLFNTLRAAMYPQDYPVPLQLHADDRGDLFEAVKGEQGGQIFVSTTHPGITRGDHFHRHKVERFLVVRGKARIQVRRLFDDQVVELEVSGERPEYVDMPTLHTHNITNIGEGDLLTMFWSHEIFDPANPDTLWEKV